MKTFLFFSFLSAVVASADLQNPPAPVPLPQAGLVDRVGAWAPGGFCDQFRSIEVRHRPNVDAPWGEWVHHSSYANQFNLDDALLALVEDSCDRGVSSLVEFREAPEFMDAPVLIAAR